MDDVLMIVVGVLVSGFFTHLVTNHMGEKKVERVLTKIEGLSDSINLLTLSLKEYVKQGDHKEDIKDIYDKIERVEERMALCSGCKNYEKRG